MRSFPIIGILAAAILAGAGEVEGQPAGAGPREPAALAAELKTTFQNRLDAVTRDLDGVLGYAIVDATSGETVAARLAGEVFPTASTIKLAILYELLKQADEGGIALDRSTPVAPGQIVGGSGVLQHLSSPTLSLRDHATLMIVLSDNTATNIVIDAVRMPAVAARMDALGLPDVRLRRKMMDGAAARRGDENVASPASLARLATWLWKGEGLAEPNRDAARKMLSAGTGAVRAAVPAAVPVFSKTGELAGVRAEAAVVALEGRPFSLAVMTTYLKNDRDGVAAIGRIASAAFEYFQRLAEGGAYGRRSP